MTKRNLIWLGAFLAVAAVMLLFTQRPVPPAPSKGPAAMDPLNNVYQVVKSQSYRKVDDDALIRGAIGGIVSAVDEFSTYVPQGRIESFQRRMDGIESGLGLRLESCMDQIRVLRVIYGSPAQQAGLVGGEILLEVDDKPVTGEDPAELEQRINEGPIGSAVSLKMLTSDGQIELKLQRRELAVESVAGLFRDAGGHWLCLVQEAPAIAYVRIREFLPDTAEQLQMVLRQVDAMRGLVLDLRDNPGGRLPSAVEVADLFLKEGPIVTVVGKDQHPQVTYARAEGTFPDDIRLVVLVDSQTASAAEIVAGALQANRRAVLVGERTKGKGCIQSMIRLGGDLGQVNLTTGEFFIGDGKPISRQVGASQWGIEPDVKVVIPAAWRTQLARVWASAELPLVLQAAPAGKTGKKAATQATSTAATRRSWWSPGPKVDQTKTGSPNSSPAEPTDQEALIAGRLIGADDQLATALELLDDGQQIDVILSRPVPGKVASQPASQPGTATSNNQP